MTFIKFVGIKEDLFNIEAEVVAVIPTKSNDSSQKLRLVDGSKFSSQRGLS